MVRELWCALLVIGFGVAPTWAAEPRDPFANVLAFGASVTHATPALIPGFDWGVRRAEDWASLRGRYTRPPGVPAKPRPYGLSPVRYVVSHFRTKKAAKRVNYISRWRTYYDEDVGSAQCGAMLYGDKRPLFDRATMIFGIDAFYWDAVWNNCGAGLDEVMMDFIGAARDAGKTLVLGNVPIENAANVRIDSGRLGVPLWWPPHPRCAARINDLLARECRVEDGCYVVDVKGTVDRLNAGERLALRNGQSYGLFEMRPDGVHLSDVGSRYAAELVISAFERHPPRVR